VEQVVVAEACTTPGRRGKSGLLQVRGGQRGVQLPIHNAAQHDAQVTGHSTWLTTACRSAATRAGKGNSTPQELMDRRFTAAMPGHFRQSASLIMPSSNVTVKHCCGGLVLEAAAIRS
jgi:hypothetical protein